MNLKKILYFSIYLEIILCTYNTEKKIKYCNFTTHCPQAGKEFSVDIFYSQKNAKE
jgi:hypothetical protein